MERHEIKALADDMLDDLNAVFRLAGIKVKSFHQLPNGYCSDTCCLHRPWMLAETKYGLIKIGWRKRVLSIDWPKETGVKGKDVLPKEDEYVTSFDNGVHAWGYPKAIEYLQKFVEIADRVVSNKEADARLTERELEEYRNLVNASTDEFQKLEEKG